MRPLLQLSAGMLAGMFVVRERRRRQMAERAAAAVLETLLRAIDANDADTGAHVRRVAEYSLILGTAADLDERTCSSIERVALFHDIGKIHEALFDIIHDERDLTEEARSEIRTHPRRGADVLAPLATFYPDLSEGVLSHHERWDGSGYPRGLAGEAIPLAARIVAIADAFDAITHGRRYRNARSAPDAVDTLMRGRGVQFDPDLVDLFLSPPVLADVMRMLRENHEPRPRRVARPKPAEDQGLASLSFRWRTTTPAPAEPASERASERAPEISP